METKICKRCQEELSIDRFKSIKGKILDVCKSCTQKSHSEKQRMRKELIASLQDSISELKSDLEDARKTIKKKEITEAKLLQDVKKAYGDNYSPFGQDNCAIKCCDCGNLFVGHCVIKYCSECSIKRYKEQTSNKDKKRTETGRYKTEEYREWRRKRWAEREDVRLKYKEYKTKPEVRERIKITRLNRHNSMSEAEKQLEIEKKKQYYQENRERLKQKNIELPNSIIKGRLIAKGWHPNDITEDRIGIERLMIQIRRKGREERAIESIIKKPKGRPRKQITNN